MRHTACRAACCGRRGIDDYACPGIATQSTQRGTTLIRLSPDGSYRIEQADYAPEHDVR